MSHLDFPFRFDGRGHTGVRDDAGYVRQLLELLLFTNPGERVNRPDFGGGILPLVFAPAGPEVEAALKVSIQANLQRWLGPMIDVQNLDVSAGEARIVIELSYAVRRTGETRTERLTQAV